MIPVKEHLLTGVYGTGGKNLGLCCQYVTLFSQEVLKGWFPKAPGTKSLADKHFFFHQNMSRLLFVSVQLNTGPEIRVSLKGKEARPTDSNHQCYEVLTSAFLDSRVMELHKNVSIQCLCVATFKQRWQREAFGPWQLLPCMRSLFFPALTGTR